MEVQQVWPLNVAKLRQRENLPQEEITRELARRGAHLNR